MASQFSAAANGDTNRIRHDERAAGCVVEARRPNESFVLVVRRRRRRAFTTTLEATFFGSARAVSLGSRAVLLRRPDKDRGARDPLGEEKFLE